MPASAAMKREQGCFQCSRRRIVCDRNEPSCLKCAKKGIECSGLGRIRFAAGVARRGRLKDCKIARIEGNDEFQALPITTEFQTALVWPGEGTAKKKQRDVRKSTAARIAMKPKLLAPIQSEDGVRPTVPSMKQAAIDEEDNDGRENICRAGHPVVKAYPQHYDVVPWIAPIAPELRMLLSYFSDFVAPVMVVLDDDTNGYRSLVLPMAIEDEVLCRAVNVVAAQHLSRQRPELQRAAEAERAAVISRLRCDSLKQSADKVFNKFTWATLIVLLVGETVTGSADYGFLIQMLLSLSMSNPGRDANPVLFNFLQAQTHMFELLGIPLLGEEMGLLTTMRASESLMSWLSYPHLPENSEDRRLADLIRQCFLSACDIYMGTAANVNAISTFPDSIQTHLIQRLIDKVSKILPDTRGAHALVWVCFVAGAASTDQSQREFLVHCMEHIYTRTQFRNIPTAIQSLRNIWARAYGERWTVCLPRLSSVLAM
ncbi:hypothetical protein AA0116_g11778 [Alternaria tenuissima]|nr:hypothetical protein AA0116_g11778 [Alternaria tenuissima]